MTKAYILIKTQVGRTDLVQAALRHLPGVQAADMVIGPYDVIAVVQGADLDAIGKLVLNEIHGVSGVESTLTCPVVER